MKVYPQRISRGNDVKFRERVMHEIRKAATLKHPGIAAIYRGDVLDNGWPFIVMERSPGTSLKECRDELLRKPASERSYLLGAVYRALTHAEDRKILHGDLHFGNVILPSEVPSIVRLEDGQIQIGQPVQAIDFGTSFLSGRRDSEKRHARLLREFTYDLLPELASYCDPLPSLKRHRGVAMLPVLKDAHGVYSLVMNEEERNRLGIQLPDYLDEPELNALRLAMFAARLQDFSLGVLFAGLTERYSADYIALIKRGIAYFLNNGQVGPSAQGEPFLVLLKEHGFIVDDAARHYIGSTAI